MVNQSATAGPPNSSAIFKVPVFLVRHTPRTHHMFPERDGILHFRPRNTNKKGGGANARDVKVGHHVGLVLACRRQYRKT